MEGDHPFENLASTLREKRDEYTLRTVYALEDSLDQTLIDETVSTIVNRDDYRHETASSSADGHLGVLLGQYIGEIEEVVEDDHIISEAYDTISQTPEASATAAANIPVEQLPETVRENIFVGGEDFSSSQITTRLRKMQGAGRCHKLEPRHEKVLIQENPTRNNTIITLEGEPVGSLKYHGSTSMLALQDIIQGERQVLQKGMTYRVSHPMIEEMYLVKKDTNQQEYQDWEVREPERLEVRPLRIARGKEEETIQEFRNRINTTRNDLEDQLQDF